MAADEATGHVLTIDLGTSGPKVALFTLAGKYVDGDFTPVELKLLPNDGAEHHALSDYEWSVIRPMLPNKPRGIPQVDDRRILDGIF